ncbi:hypothetical protein AAFF_G00233780 [Aldrovandia affinis]|uniref:Uncharacterized protein n=1 Tax=Aldrovandia affinis TaxID=143900 RepID=A0AAD7W477_9TELE|nr:hypothetical protein AAFF_G00233780 [Aldrovandia affinis]
MSSTTDESGCSGNANEQEREQEQLQQEANVSPAATSQVHRQPVEPEQETGTAAAASHVHRQPEQEAAACSAAAAGQVQQREEVHRKSDSEGEESAFRLKALSSPSESDLRCTSSSGEECGTSSDRSGMGRTTIWTAAQFKVKQTYYPGL